VLFGWDVQEKDSNKKNEKRQWGQLSHAMFGGDFLDEDVGLDAKKKVE